MNTKVADLIAVVIAIGWIMSVIADILVEEFQPSAFVYMTMAGLSSAVFGKRFVEGFRPASLPPLSPPEAKRELAEAGRKVAEQDRVVAEDDRVHAEDDRIDQQAKDAAAMEKAVRQVIERLTQRDREQQQRALPNPNQGDDDAAY